VLNEDTIKLSTSDAQADAGLCSTSRRKVQLASLSGADYIRQPSETIVVARYDSEFMGLRSRQDYRVINLWEVDAELAFQPSLRSLLPFVPMLRGGGEEYVVRRAVQRLRDDEQ
jgi:hypothetical protein